MSLSEADREQIAQARAAALTTAEEAFDKLDINSDGDVDRSEVAALAQQGVGLPDGANAAEKEAKIKEFFDNFDANGDGKIQKSEWLDFFGKLFDSVIEAGMQQWAFYDKPAGTI